MKHHRRRSVEKGVFGASGEGHNSARQQQGSPALEPGPLSRRRAVPVLIACVLYSIVLLVSTAGHVSPFSSIQYLVGASTTATPLLPCFQVAPPVLTPAGAESCSTTLMVYSFANSYGNPFVGDYKPPSCKFNRIIFNFTVVSAGRQFDRLGVFYFNDTEIFRTSTAEPTATGIEWTYLKDMTPYLSMFKEPQTFIADIGNLINEIYTAPFNTTLTATFFHDDEATDAADLIVPVSARQGSQSKPSAWSVPETPATLAVQLPQNIKKAVFSISACGQSAEEFWWSNVLSSDVNTFPETTLYGFSPFREVQLLIDGSMAGVAWPFPVIFTGGVNPGFWRPEVGIDAFDLKEDEIDITPFLGLLCDGTEHTFEIRVIGLSDDGNGQGAIVNSVGNYWVVTGKVFVWLDEGGSVTTGTQPLIEVAPADIKLSSTVGTTGNGTNSTLDYQVSVQRSLTITSTIETSEGTNDVSWKQSVAFTNSGDFRDKGNIQLNIQKTTGQDESYSGYQHAYTYPLLANSTYTTYAGSDNFTIAASIDRGKDTKTLGTAVFPSGLESFEDAAQYEGSTLTTRQNGTATFYSIPSESRSAGLGSTEQELKFSGIPSSQPYDPYDATPGHPVELYSRHVLASNLSVVFDYEMIAGQEHENFWAASTQPQSLDQDFAFTRVGRGPEKEQNRDTL